MAVTGRPSTYTPEIAAAICQQLSEGMPLRAICRQEGFPAWPTVYDWMKRDKDLSIAIACARELGGDAIAEDTLNMIDADPERGPDGKVDQGWVQLQKLRVEHRLKLLAKWNPKRYGDRIDLGNADGQPFQITVAK